jgi:exonuclease III
VYKPDVLFLCETLSTAAKLEELRNVLGFDSCFSVNRQGRGGGLSFMWRSSFNCSITSFSANHVDVEVVDNIIGNWRLTGFYGFPDNGRRRESWNFLRQLAQVSNLPWCVLGDFNDILSPSEKKGRTDRAPYLINGFRSAVLDSGLADVHMEGYLYTWFKSLGTVRAVEERLDRALANDAWSQKFPNAILENLPAPASDHYPIMLVREPESLGEDFDPISSLKTRGLPNLSLRSLLLIGGFHMVTIKCQGSWICVLQTLIVGA